MARIEICCKIRILCAIFWAKISICAILYAISISDYAISEKLHSARLSKRVFPLKRYFAGLCFFPRLFLGWGGGRVGFSMKNLLLCAHQPIGGEIWATHGFWAPTQSGFFRTIGKGGKRAEAVLYCFCPSAYSTGTLILQQHRGWVLHEFSIYVQVAHPF